MPSQDRKTAVTDKSANKMWGGRFPCHRPRSWRRSTPPSASTRLWRQDIRASKAHAAMLAEQGIISKDDAREDQRGLDQVLAEIESGDVHVLARARRHAHERREPAQGADRRAGRAAAHGALAQRPGGDRFPAVCARLASTAPTRRWPGCNWRWRARPRRTPTPSCRGSRICSRPSRSPSATICWPMSRCSARDRGRLRRCTGAAQRKPAGLGGAGRHVLPDRPAHDGRGARLRPADGQLARRRVGPRLRPGDAGRRRDLRHAPVAAGRGDRASG